jgi:hypothetical protein
VFILGPWRLLRSVNHSDDIHLIRLKVIDDPVGPFKDFTNLWKLGFGNDAAGFWEIADLLRASCQTVDNSLCALWRALSDVGFEGGLSLCRSSGPSFWESE